MILCHGRQWMDVTLVVPQLRRRADTVLRTLVVPQLRRRAVVPQLRRRADTGRQVPSKRVVVPHHQRHRRSVRTHPRRSLPTHLYRRPQLRCFPTAEQRLTENESLFSRMREHSGQRYFKNAGNRGYAV